jgi:short-subunit dehydrogenase
MLKQNTDGHIVNTASVAGLQSGPGSGIYKVTKHGVVSLSETLYHELTLIRSKIGVSVLCPGVVKTRIGDSARNRPAELQNEPIKENRDPEFDEQEQQFKKGRWMFPNQVADCVFDAIINQKFYILTHPEFKTRVRVRMGDILLERNPTNPFK